MFEFHGPDEVHGWVDSFVERSEERQNLSVGQLLAALSDIGVHGPDELETSVVAHHMRLRSDNNSFPAEGDIRRAIEGLGVFLPSIVRISNKQVYLSASPADIRDALVEQLQLLPESIRLNIDPGL